MENKTRRPASIWITEVIIIMVTLAWLSPSIFYLIRCWRTFSLLTRPILMLFLYIAIITSITTFTLWGLHKRKVYGRWLGVGLLILLLGLMLRSPSSRMAYTYIFSLGSKREALPPSYYEYSNQSQLMGGITATLLFDAGLLLLILRLAFAKPAKRYFERGNKVVPQE
jgi:hypothetical protein